MNSQSSYVCDADSLINLKNHFPKRFGKTLKKKVENGTLKIPEGVYRELREHADSLKTKVQQWENSYDFVIIIKFNLQVKAELPRIERAYGKEIIVGNRWYNGFWASKRGKEAADGQVVAIGKVLNRVVVSDDVAVKMACLLEDVGHIGWAEFARRFGLGNTGTLFDST